MRAPSLFFICLLFLFACNPQKQAQQEQAESIPDDPDTVAVSPEPAAQPAKQIYRVETPFGFSSAESFDKFGLVVMGQNIFDATATFTVTTADGTELYREEFPTTDLIDPSFLADRDTPPTDKERKAYLVKRLKEFFGESNFSQPAIGPQDEFDASRSDKAIWDEIAADPQSAGFYFLIGDEAAKEIVFSKRQGKVVVLRTW